MSNISEGFESRTRAQFIDYLGRAKASAGEVRCQLYITYDQEYLNDQERDAVSDLTDKVSRQFYHLVRHLEEGDEGGHVRELPSEYIAEAS